MFEKQVLFFGKKEIGSKVYQRWVSIDGCRWRFSTHAPAPKLASNIPSKHRHATKPAMLCAAPEHIATVPQQTQSVAM